MTPREFAPIWLRMLRAWPAAKPVEGTASEYAARLADFTAAEVSGVVDQLICTHEFIPSIAAIWQRCVDGRDPAPSWEQAWREAIDHVTGSGLPWSHEAVADAAEAIGRYQIRTGEEGVVRAHFRDAYRAITAARRNEYAARVRALPPAPRPALEPSR